MCRRSRLAALGLSLALLLGCLPATTEAAFDYWVLALSWSPEYCASSEARPGSKQCAQAREFIVHGLWPQYERGYPEFCDTQARVPEYVADRLAPLVPDRGLVYHQWKKHGSCSGLDVEEYFAAVERAAGSVRIPGPALALAATQRTTRAQLERDFIALNPGLGSDTITFECRRGYLREVRICLDQALMPRTCGPDVRENCGRDLRVRATETNAR